MVVNLLSGRGAPFLCLAWGASHRDRVIIHERQRNFNAYFGVFAKYKGVHTPAESAKYTKK
jgi:hypothetical protein